MCNVKGENVKLSHRAQQVPGIPDRDIVTLVHYQCRTVGQSLDNILTSLCLRLTMSRRTDKDSVVIKVIVLGSANVGKTALMERYCSNRFSDRRHPTIGSDFRTKILEIHDTEIILQVWDTAVSIHHLFCHFLDSFCSIMERQ